MGTTTKKAAALGAVITLGALGAACAPVPAYYGEAVAYNKAIQTVNPAPVYTADGAQPGDNGERAAMAVDNYRSGNVSIGRGGAGGRGGSGGSGGGFGGGAMGGLGAATGPR